MASKLCPHYQGQPELNTEATEVVRASQMAWAKGVDVHTWATPAREMFPNQSVLARCYMPESAEESYMRNGVSGARLYFQALQPTYAKLLTSGVVAIEGPNEHYPDRSWLGAYNDFACQWIEQVAGFGLRPAWVTSTGLPGLLKYGDETRGPTARDLAPIFAALWTYDGIYCPHEYGCPTLHGSTPWLTLRYRDVIAELATVSALVREVPIIISECGVDGGVCAPAKPGTGWKNYLDVTEYKAELIWYDEELCRDPQVIAATPFTTCPTGQWASYDVDGEMLAWMASRYDEEPEPPEPPEPPTPPELVTVPRDMLDSWANRLTAIVRQASSIEDSADSLLVEMEMLLDGGRE
jgi:hypothetical protein